MPCGMGCCGLEVASHITNTRVPFAPAPTGAHCGFLAGLGSLASGAARAYTPEEGVSINDLQVRSANSTPRIFTYSMA